MTVAVDVIAAARAVADQYRAWQRGEDPPEDYGAPDRLIAALEQYDARPMVTGSGTVDAMLRRLADLTDPADGAALSDSEAGTITDAADLIERLGLEAVRAIDLLERSRARESVTVRELLAARQRHAEQVKLLETVIAALAPHRLAVGLEPGYAGQVRISSHVLERAAGLVVELVADLENVGDLVVRFAR